jgi:desulfoferrodoxin (superoxide reductase-like protein)
MNHLIPPICVIEFTKKHSTRFEKIHELSPDSLTRFPICIKCFKCYNENQFKIFNKEVLGRLTFKEENDYVEHLKISEEYHQNGFVLFQLPSAIRSKNKFELLNHCSGQGVNIFSNESLDTRGRCKGRRSYVFDSFKNQSVISYFDEVEQCASKISIPDNYFGSCAIHNVYDDLTTHAKKKMSLDIIKKRSCISANKTALLMRDKTLLEMQMTHRDNNTPGLVIIIPETHEYTIHMIPGSHKNTATSLPINAVEMFTIPRDSVLLMFSTLVHGGCRARQSKKTGEGSRVDPLRKTGHNSANYPKKQKTTQTIEGKTKKHYPLTKYNVTNDTMDISVHVYASYPHIASDVSGISFPYISMYDSTKEMPSAKKLVSNAKGRGCFTKSQHDMIHSKWCEHFTTLRGKKQEDVNKGNEKKNKVVFHEEVINLPHDGEFCTIRNDCYELLISSQK